MEQKRREKPIPPPSLIIREGEDPRLARGLPRELPIYGEHIPDLDIRTSTATNKKE
jgi:hypothetical protein